MLAYQSVMFIVLDASVSSEEYTMMQVYSPKYSQATQAPAITLQWL